MSKKNNLHSLILNSSLIEKMVTVTELPASHNLFCSSNFTDVYNKYDNSNEKVDTLGELPKCDTDAK